jgi:prevent-host-death family protein
MSRGSYNGKDRPSTDNEWQLQEAKACFSEVVRRSQEQPQRVTVHGKPSVVVVSAEFFDRMLPESGADLIKLMTKAASDDLEFGERGEAMPVREVEL